MEPDARIDYHGEEYMKYKTKKLINIAYELKRKKENGIDLSNMIGDVKRMELLADNLSIQRKYFNSNDISNGIFKFIEESLNI
jgi:hypothetical protein